MHAENLKSNSTLCMLAAFRGDGGLILVLLLNLSPKLLLTSKALLHHSQPLVVSKPLIVFMMPSAARTSDSNSTATVAAIMG